MPKVKNTGSVALIVTGIAGGRAKVAPGEVIEVADAEVAAGLCEGSFELVTDAPQSVAPAASNDEDEE